MRPAGGYTPDMMNYAHSTDVYQIWADMVTANARLLPDRNEDHYCVYASRRDFHNYVHSHEEVMAKYGHLIEMNERAPEILSGAMGNYLYIAHAASVEDVHEFIDFVHAKY